MSRTVFKGLFLIIVLLCFILTANASATPSPGPTSAYNVNAAQQDAVNQMAAINKSLSGVFQPLTCPAGFNCNPILPTGQDSKLDPASKLTVVGKNSGKDLADKKIRRITHTVLT